VLNRCKLHLESNDSSFIIPFVQLAVSTPLPGAINIFVLRIVSYWRPSTYLVKRAGMGFCWRALLVFFHSLLSKVGELVIDLHFGDRFVKY
jgi:hypothetical protein